MELLTIGYEKRELKDFIVLLAENEVEILADIRINPISRKKGVSKKGLQAALALEGIEYIHFRELGTPQDIRDNLHSDWDFGLFFKAYKEHLKTQTKALNKLNELASNHKICLMCFERDINQCHRKAVAEKLSKMNKDLRILNL